MRIEALDLRAFGPFTGARIDFAAGPSGLYVIYGGNEAGKSSALRGLAGGLFGIPGQTPDNFLHEYTALRIGMRLANADGARLSFVRRKGRTKTLWNEDESEALEDGVLAAFLSDVDEEEFPRVFGLDHVRLRDGSDRLLTSAEGADEAIVGAALGVSGMRTVAAAIDEEAGRLFAPRGSTRAINAAISEWTELQKKVRADSLSMSAWTEARRGAERSAAECEEADERVTKLRERERELEFVARNRPRVARLRLLRAKLEELAPVPDLGVDFGDRHRAAESELRSACVLLDQARREERDATERLERLPGDFSFLDTVPEVEQLRELSVVTAKGEQDRERRRAEARAAAAERDRIAQSLGLAVPLEARAIEELRIALRTQPQGQALLQERAGLVRSRKDVEERRGALRRDRAACEHRLGAASDVPDYARLEQAIAAARRLGDVDATLDDLGRQLAADDDALASGLARLPGFGGVAEDLEARPVPGAELLRDFRRRFDELEDEEKQARREAGEAREKRDALERDVERLAIEQAIPSEDDLKRARGRRDEQWRLVRRAWLDGADVDEPARALDPDRPLAESFERSVAEGDDVGDRLRRESQRVAELAGKRRERDDLDGRLARMEEAAGDRASRRAALEREWSGAWEGSGLSVGRPAEMQDALAEHAKLVELLGRRRATAAKRDEAAGRLRAARGELAAALEATGGSAGAASSSGADGRLAPILERAEAHRQTLVAQGEARAKDEAERARLDRELAGEREKEERLDRDLAEWEGRFALARRGLPWREGDPPEVVTRVYEEVASLVRHADDEASLQNRIASIDKDSRELADRLQAFRAAHAPGLPDESPAATISRLGSLVERGKRDRQLRESAAEALQRIEERRKKEEARVEIAERTLAGLALEAGAASTDDLPTTVRRADEKRELREALDTLEQDLLGEGCAIDRTEARVAALEGCDAEAELVPLRDEIDKAVSDAKEKGDAATKARVAFEELERRSGAAERAAEAEAIAARLRDDVERYVRLVFAARLLRAAVERFRERNEAPMLKHASRYLGGLTRGAYTKVETDVDDKNRPFFLVREAASSAAKTVQALSDGTRDQLHLALVLGSLEHRFSAGAEPMPLVLDDVLVHFDDARSRAALETLAEFSKITQVLLFTHHERIREQAGGIGVVCSI